MVRTEQMVVGNVKILIFGAAGLLGSELSLVFSDAVKLRHADVDIRNKEKVIEVILSNMPDIVINAAAYTTVDDCESKQELAFEINGKAPGYIAQGCKMANSTFVHYSTDYVFNGLRKEYYETDIPDPINIYGLSKRIGETNIINNVKDYKIIRTSWLFGKHGKNFVNTMLSLSKKIRHVKVVNDQFGKPTYAVDLARKTEEIIRLPNGIYHITNEGICSWFEFASAIINNAISCTSKEFPMIAKRPEYSVLMNTKTTHMKHWRDALAEYLIGLS